LPTPWRSHPEGQATARFRDNRAQARLPRDVFAPGRTATVVNGRVHVQLGDRRQQGSAPPHTFLRHMDAALSGQHQGPQRPTGGIKVTHCEHGGDEQIVPLLGFVDEHVPGHVGRLVIPGYLEAKRSPRTLGGSLSEK
jgi:hypothetical protein